jgi:hypothetical protein
MEAMEAYNVPVIHVPSDIDPSGLTQVRLAHEATAAAKVTAAKFAQVLASITPAEFDALADEAEQDRVAALAQWRTKELAKRAKTASTAVAGGRGRGRGRVLRGRGRGRGVKRHRDGQPATTTDPHFVSAAGRAEGIAAAAQQLGDQALEHLDELLQAGEQAKLVTAAGAALGTDADGDADADADDADAGADSLDAAAPADLQPFTVQRMMAHVIVKKLTLVHRPVRPTLKLKQVSVKDGEPVDEPAPADPRVHMLAQQLQATMLAQKSIDSNTKEQRSKLAEAIALCKRHLEPVIQTRGPGYTYAGRLVEANNKERTVTVKLKTREVPTKRLNLTVVSSMVREAVTTAVPADLADQPFQRGVHSALLMKQPASLVLSRVADNMGAFLRENRQLVTVVAYRRSRAREAREEDTSSASSRSRSRSSSGSGSRGSDSD